MVSFPFFVVACHENAVARTAEETALAYLRIIPQSAPGRGRARSVASVRSNAADGTEAVPPV